MTTSASASTLVNAERSFIARSWAYHLLQLATRRRMLVSAIVFTALIACDVLLWKTVPCNLLNFLDPVTLGGESLVLAGVFLRSWAAGTLFKSEQVIQSGPYRFVRNPLYIGSFLMMLGFSVLLHDWIAFWIVLGPVLAMYLNKVKQEERYLQMNFPAEWEAYSRQVNAFVPTLNAWPSFAGFSWQQWARNREYQAALASAAGFLGIALWYRVMIS